MKPLCFFACLAFILVAGCDGQSGSVSRVQVVAKAKAAPMSDGERFGIQEEPTPAPILKPFEYTLPEGWSEGPLRAMRDVNIAIAAAPKIECYATTLRGSGNVRANVNRWRKQMSLAPLGRGEAPAGEKISILGKAGVLFEMQGDYVAMGQSRHPDWTLLGVICPMRDKTLFVKMIGPADSVAGERAAFVKFCGSLRANE